MNTTIFSKNIKKFRQQKNLTQEQAAECLHVSTQTISRWECGVTVPDAMLLPQIARTYCVTIDDLYKESCTAYENYAQRLGALYMATRKPEDALAAYLEFEKLKALGQYSAEDGRMQTAIFISIMRCCKDRAIAHIEKTIQKNQQENNTAPSNSIYWQARMQKSVFYYTLGATDYICDLQIQILAQNPGNYIEHVLTIDTLRLCGNLESAYAYFKKAVKKFPNNFDILVSGAEVCKLLKRFDEGILYADQAYALPEPSSSLYDAITPLRIKAFCLEGRGDHRDAYSIYLKMIDTLTNSGYEAYHEKKHAESCKAKITE